MYYCSNNHSFAGILQSLETMHVYFRPVRDPAIDVAVWGVSDGGVFRVRFMVIDMLKY